MYTVCCGLVGRCPRLQISDVLPASVAEVAASTVASEVREDGSCFPSFGVSLTVVLPGF
jgi:hypothetical protein